MIFEFPFPLIIIASDLNVSKIKADTIPSLIDSMSLNSIFFVFCNIFFEHIASSSIHHFSKQYLKIRKSETIVIKPQNEIMIKEVTILLMFLSFEITPKYSNHHICMFYFIKLINFFLDISK